MSDKNRHNILDINDALEKIFSFTSGLTDHEEFYRDELVFDAVMMNFIVIGEAVSRLSADFIEKKFTDKLEKNKRIKEYYRP